MVLACKDPIRAFLIAIAGLNRQINAPSQLHRRLWWRRRKRVNEFGSITRHDWTICHQRRRLLASAALTSIARHA
jgi:hypothetical protein